jgi:predicted DNA-binding transcriptional regulator AlpA
MYGTAVGRNLFSTGAEQMTDFGVSVQDVAECVGIAKGSVCRRIEHRAFPAHEIGRLWEFKPSKADAWVRAPDEEGELR